MSTNNVNIVNTNNWFQKMNNIGTQNVTNMVLSGTDSNVQMALISVANDVHYCYSNYPLSKTNGFTLTFQLYITGTNMNSICAYFGVTDPTTGFDANGGLANQSGAVELMIRPGTIGLEAGQSRFNLYTNYGSNTIAATDSTAVATGAWQTIKITYTPNSVGTWVVNYNGTNIISYNDSSYTTFANNQNTVWGIYGATSNTVSTSIRAVDLSVKQSMPLSVLKNTYSFYPEECYINKLSTHSQTNLGAAFGLRLLKADYLGPVINVRRGSDNATLDFYADSKGNLGTNLQGNGQTLLTWLAGSIGYVTKWYDQSNNGRDVINSENAYIASPTTPVLDQISAGGKSAAKGIYSLSLANSSYTGPTIKLRRSSDSAVSDFYADVYGNLGTGINATGTSFTSWIVSRSNIAYVDTWYDQSGSGFHATQSTTSNQPVYNGVLKLLDFSTQYSFLNMGTASSGPIPTGTLNAPYTFVTRHGAVGSTPGNGAVIAAGGNAVQNQLNGIGLFPNYGNYWYANDLQNIAVTNIGNTFVARYNGTNRIGYVNNNMMATAASSGYTVATAQQYIGRDPRGVSTSFSGELYELFIFNTAISDSDRLTCTASTSQPKIGTPVLDTISSSAKGNARGVYTLYRANSTYTGPTIKLRRSSDNAVSDFYADIYGNLTNATRTSFSSWITESTINYPGSSMTSDTSVLSDGTYISTFSSTAAGNAETGYRAFDNDLSTNYTCVVSRYSKTTGAYIGAVSTTMTSAAYSGEWLQLQLPSNIVLTQYTLTSSTIYGRSPVTFYLGGSTNGSTWDLLDTQSNLSWSQTAQTSKTFNINNTTGYNYYRIVCNSVTGTDNGGVHSFNAFCSISELKFNSSYSVAYVDTWYDQSGSGNHATQSTTAFQPVYNGTLKLIDSSQNSNTLFLNMPSGTVPTGTLNAPYSFVVKHGSISNVGAFIGAGSQSNNQSNVLRCASAESSAYRNYWWFNDFDIGSPSDIVSGTTVTITYNGTVQSGYINKGGADTLFKTDSSRTGATTAAGQQSLFRNNNAGEYLNGQMYSVFIFGSALSDSDRYACQANPTDINIKYDGCQSLYNGSSNLPLTAGLDTYTYVCNYTPAPVRAFSSVFEQSSNPHVSNQRAAFAINSNSIYFSGQGNDVLNAYNISYYTPRKTIMTCNHNLSSGNVILNDNGTTYTYTTSSSPSTLAVGASVFSIGRNAVGTEFYAGNINEIIVFRNTLTPKENQFYFIPDAITRKDYRSKTSLQIKDIPKDIGLVRSGAVVALDTQMLQNMSPGALISSWGGFTAYNSPVLNAAANSTTSTPIPPYVSLTNNNVASSLSTGKYLDLGSKTFNINTNGGFTAVWYGAFTGTANNFERIFDFGSGQANNNLIVYRETTSTSLNFGLFNSSTPYVITTTGGITQNEWAVWTFRYTASTRLMEILKNGISLVTGTAGAAITDRTLTSNRIGRSNWASGDTYGSINMTGLYVYSSFLTDAQVASISNHLMYPNSSNLPSVLPDYNNKVVRYGSVLSQGFRDGQAMYFNGNLGSYLDIQDVPNWPLTFSFWFWNSSTAATTPAALCSADLTGWGIQTDIGSNGTVLTPYYSTNGSSWVAMTASTVALNAWYHITYVVTPTTVAYYLNGSLVQSVSAVVYNTNRIIIGKSGDNGRPLNGYISDVRVYDYALRADEISILGAGQTSQYGRYLSNYNTPVNYLVNVRNWYNTSLTTYKSGSFSIVAGFSDPEFYIQLTNNTVANSSNTLYNSTRIQDYNSFTCAFSIYTDNVTDHGYYFYCGATALTTVPTGTAGTSANSGYYIYFLLTGTRGVYLFNDQGQQLAYSPFPNGGVITNSVYVPITIVYNRSVTKTWTVNFGSQDVIVFNDPNNANWVSNIAGDFWGIGARTTTSAMRCFIRRVELSYTPYENRLSTVANVQNNTKFPPGAMTAASTTFTGTDVLDGVYTASQSSGTEPAYYAFDNSTGTFAFETVNKYNGTLGAYSGAVTTTVTNLKNNITTSYSGEWLQIQVPNAVSLNSFRLMGRQDQSLFTWRSPNTFYVAGSNNGSTWELIHSTSGAQFTAGTLYFTCNAGNTNKYKYFRLIVTKIGNNGTTGDPSPNVLDVVTWDLYTQMTLVNSNVITVPPYSMTSNTTTFAGNSVYDGTYTLTSSNSAFGSLGGDIYRAFDDTYGNSSNVWSPGQYYNITTGVYTGSVSTTVSGVTQSGEWVQIQIPNPIVLYSFSLNFWWSDSIYVARSFLIAASNDNSTWTNIYDNTNVNNWVYGTAQTFVVTGSPNAYRYFRLIVRRAGNFDSVTLANNVNGFNYQSWWVLDQWKLYTNESDFNLMKFPPAPLTADSPVTFTTVNTNNWYNVMTYGTNSWYSPVLSGTDPLKQLQLTPGSGSVGTYCKVTNQPVMNYNSFTLTFGLFCTNTNNGDYITLYFGSGAYQVQFNFEIYYYQGIRLSTTNVTNAVSSATNWFNSTWNNIRIVYNRSATNTWTLFFNETQIIQYSDPNWYKTPGGEWGFNAFNGDAHFSSYIRQLEMKINPVSLPGTSIVSGSYIASASSNYIGNLSTISSNAFNFTGNIWHSALTYSSGAYTGAVTTTVSGTSYSGEWLQLQAPNALQLSSFSIYPRQDGNGFALRSPKNFVMAGSNNGSTWDLLHTATGVNDWTSAEKYFVCNGSNVANKYTYFRLITLALNGTSASADSVNIANLSLFTPISLNNAITPATPKGLLDGLTWKYYDGTSGDSVSYYTTNTYINIGRCINTTNYNLITNGQYVVNGGETHSMEIFGYFRATVSGTYTFSLVSDDGSYFWLGSNALVGYTTGNANMSAAFGVNGSYTVTLFTGTYYPIRIHYTDNTSNNDLQFRFTPPGGTQTSNGQGYFFSGTGLDSAFPQESAKIIKDLTNTNKDGVYYILVNGISTPVHCLMNDCYDGGGWMMLMKGGNTSSNTFQYSSNYWTTKNTLNAGDLTRNNADAKYDTYNYSTVKDVLCIWPEYSPTGSTNPYGQNGGSIFVNDGWTWLLNNWNETSRITPFTGFTTSRLPHQNTLSATQTYGINNPFRYNGFSSNLFATQNGAYVHGFNRSGTGASGPSVRWGFLFNNEADLATCDTYCGIGCGGATYNISAGNVNGIVGFGNNTRFELYGR
jgi:hypothetical protein